METHALVRYAARKLSRRRAIRIKTQWYKHLLRFGIFSPITIIIKSALINPSSQLLFYQRLCQSIALQKNPLVIRHINIQEAITRSISKSIELSLYSLNNHLLRQHAIKNQEWYFVITLVFETASSSDNPTPSSPPLTSPMPLLLSVTTTWPTKKPN